MYIFYDFETSSRELIGQIMTYSFIVTDSNYKIKDELTGAISLTRIQLPEIDAILTNKINVTEHQKNSDLEYEAAEKIHQFLEKQCQRKTMTLVGFNSNQFDLGFLRNLLIKYGYNPYFRGKLQNKDVLHFSQHLAFKYPNDFKWEAKENKKGSVYYPFTLEHLSTMFSLLENAQTHNAREDVLLLIKLVQILEETTNESLESFKPVHISEEVGNLEKFNIIKQRTRHFPSENEPLEKYVFQYWMILDSHPKSVLCLDLNRFRSFLETQDSIKDEDALQCVKYINFNKHWFEIEKLDRNEEEEFEGIVFIAKEIPVLENLTQDKYFELSKKDWDIEYQIHELGFDRITMLDFLFKELLRNPDGYKDTVTELWSKREGEKDKYLVQLYNRAYLNFHPNPSLEHLKKYITPRYITGTLQRNSEEFESLENQIKRINALLQNSDITEDDKTLIKEIQKFYENFIKVNNITFN